MKSIIEKTKNLGLELILKTFRGSEKQNNLFLCYKKGEIRDFKCKFWLKSPKIVFSDNLENKYCRLLQILSNFQHH